MHSPMKQVVLLSALAVIPGVPLFGLDIAGSWQGFLQSPQGPPFRILIKISSVGGESLKAVLFNIDQGAQPLYPSSVSLQGRNLTIVVASQRANYDGRLNGNGSSIAGTWTQGGYTTPMTLTRATPENAWLIREPQTPPKPMAADANPGFEVATIKPSNPDTPGQSILVGRGGINLLTTTNTTLSDLIAFAYGIHARQVTGGPGWVETEKYDLSVKPDHDGIPNDTQVRSMLQKLLAERFQLAFRREKKELPAYAITVGKSGPKLARNEAGGNLPRFSGPGPGGLVVRNSTIKQFAGFLQARIVDRPVVDQTDLSDRFDFTLLWRPDQLASSGPNVPPLPSDLESRSDLFTAIQEQLGLKLAAIRAPVEILIIEQLQKASEN